MRSVLAGCNLRTTASSVASIKSDCQERDKTNDHENGKEGLDVGDSVKAKLTRLTQ